MTQLIADSLSRLLGAKALPRYPPFALYCEGILLPWRKHEIHHIGKAICCRANHRLHRMLCSYVCSRFLIKK